ncbi:MAG: SLOG family protein [Eubacteriales bacterium]|nr:SLOG family protein [Eubacteriales bacterium]
MKQQTCCITGHRPNKLPFGYDEGHQDCVRLKLKLAAKIEEMRGKGVTAFYTGLEEGVGIWGAEIVLDLKRAYPKEDIRLTVVIAYEGQQNRMGQAYRGRYHDILSAADVRAILHTDYKKNCMHACARYMVDASSHMIAVFDRVKGREKYTIDYARKMGLDVAVINPGEP